MRKTRGFTLIELMIVVAIIGLLSAVAIPAFVKYMRRSMTVEASMNLRRMYDGAVAYYVGEHADSAGAIHSQQFPGSTGPSPPAIPAGVKVKPDVGYFNTPEWHALDFEVTDYMRYSYAFTSGGIGSSAQATMIAQGDLDGDGLPSLFTRTCTGVVDGVRGGSSLYVLNDLE
jgi:type IV pilus assembly protein PilA